MQYAQYQFVKYAIYAICAKRFSRTAVDLRMLAVPTRLSRLTKWVSFVVRVCKNPG